MFVALVIYNSHNGVQNKLFVPKREVTLTLEGENYTVTRRSAFDTQESAQAELDAAIAKPITPSLQTNGYRTIILDLTSGTVVSDNTVAAIPQTESAAVQAN